MAEQGDEAMSLLHAYMFHFAGLLTGMVLGGCLTIWILKRKAKRVVK